MNISELSIRRPVLSTVLTLIILLFGFIGYNYLGVREYPSVDNPIISVSCSYPGANADVIENQITEPLEQNINGIPGIRSLSSVSQQGSSRITVEFELSVDLRQPPTMYVTKCHAPSVTCHATATRQPYPKPMQTPCLSSWLLCKATNARCWNSAK